MTQVALSKTALAAIDQIRAQRGIRTRAKALEVIAVEAAGAVEHPLETKKCETQKLLSQMLTRLNESKNTLNANATAQTKHIPWI